MSATTSVLPRSLQAAFRAVAEASPGRIALEQGERTMTYGALLGRVSAIAQALKDRGVRRGAMVALLADRSFDLIAGTLGILEAGAAYVPIDPAYPAERQQLILDDVRAPVLLGDAALIARVRTDARLLAFDAVEARPPAPPEEGGPEDLAYVMYTSGSTGRPKGVLVPHRGVLRLVLGSTFASFGPETCFLQLAPVSFDAATLEIFGPLLNGGRLALAGGAVPSLADIGRAIARHKVTTLWLTSGLFHAMVDERLEDLRPLRELLAGGDVLSPAHVGRVLKVLPSLRLINGYGPTENTTFSTCHTIREAPAGKAIPIGKPIEGSTCVLLGESGQVVPEGSEGELHVGGLGLALGYLNRPELTAEKFVKGPAGEPLYRTGDRARLNADGDYEFLGRGDEQLKIRGFRIEPGELEALLQSHPQIAAAAAGAREAAPGDKRLVAWFVARPSGSVDAAALRAFLHSRMPDFMVPSALREVDKLPLTPNGKVDRRALPDPFEAPPSAPAAPPRSQVEREVLGLFRDVLHRESVGVDQNFFDLGGTSLHLARLHERLEKLLGVDLEMPRLFQFPTVASLAQHLADRGKQDDLGAKAKDRAARQREAQARAAQARGRKP